MKTFKFLMVAAVAVPALTGPAFAQAPKPAHAARRMPRTPRRPRPRASTGEFVAAGRRRRRR